MEQKLIARPAFNRISRKWNITIKTSEGEIKLGHKINKDNDFFEYEEFDSKKDAEEYIRKDNRLTLRNKMAELLNKYSRNK